MKIQNVFGTEKEIRSIVESSEKSHTKYSYVIMYDKLYLLASDKLRELSQDEDISFFDGKDKLWDILVRSFVPLEGNADTVFGELLRAINYLLDWYRSGTNYSIYPYFISSWNYVIDTYRLNSVPLKLVFGFYDEWNNDVRSVMDDIISHRYFTTIDCYNPEKRISLLIAMRDSLINTPERIYNYMLTPCSNINRFFDCLRELNRVPSSYSRSEGCSED